MIELAEEESEDADDNELGEDEEIHLIDIQSEPRDEFQRSTNLQVEGGKNISCIARIDTECPITIIFKNLIKNVDIKIPDVKWNRYRGINDSKLKIIGLIRSQIAVDGES